MAITVCSTSTPSPTLPTVSLSSLSPKSSLKNPHHLHPPPPYPKLSLGLTADNGIIIEASADAVLIATAAAQAAKDARNELGREWGNGCLVRRKKRRKRRKQALEIGVDNFGEDNCKKVPFLSSASKSGNFLTRKEEAEYTLYIKEEARLESARKKILESCEHEPTLNQLAKAVGMSRGNLDKILCNGRESRERVNRCYRRLIVSIASYYLGKGLSLQDLIQEGSIGLIRGAEKFDPERGYKLSTYIYWWIRQAVIKAVATKSRTIRLPGNTYAKVTKIAEANSTLTKKLLRLPSCAEIAEAIDMDVATVRLVSHRTRAPMSLDQAVAKQGCMSLQDIIPGPEEMTPEAMLKKQLMKQSLERLLTVLCDREAHILGLRYGLNGMTPRSYDEIGRLLRLSRERVRQINQIALSKLQQNRLVNNLKVYI